MSNARRLITAVAVVLSMTTVTSLAETSALRIDVPPVPPQLEVPSGYTVFFKGSASGTQSYMCLPTAAGLAWRFIGPQATLFWQHRGEPYQQIMTHFLAPNPSEAGTLRPSWLHSFDSSQVWGRVLASSDDPAYVETGAIPWLLLEVVGAERGPVGGGILTPAAFIQRLNTSGGVAPAGGCDQAGTFVMVPYATDYYFYRPSRRR
jgi:hypothetical protein